jgi:5'-methylthioadenosine phosphorylase
MNQIKIGVIGGTGIYKIEDLKDIEEIDIDTPFGKPSDSIFTGTLDGIKVAFLPRHGRGHTILPSEIPSRANIYAMKSLGVEHIIAVASVGSLQEEIHHGELVIVDQLIDCTAGRPNTFMGNGIVAHIQFDVPFCPVLRQTLYDAALELGINDIHGKGTYVAMEGPAFSTRAESILHQSWGGDVIGMTALPEAKLAREADIFYAVIACPSNYDAWHEYKEPVSIEMITETHDRNIELTKKIIKLAVTRISPERKCVCPTAMRGAILTKPDYITGEQKKRLNLIIGKYV